MFRAAGEPTKIKKIVYLIVTTFLGLILSLDFHAFIEINYLNWAGSQGKLVTFYGNCALHPALQAAIWLAGAVGGFYLGLFWWRKVYVDRVWAKKI